MEDHLKNQTVKVTVGENTKEYPKGITYQEVVQEYPQDADAPVILVISDGKLKELHRLVERDCHVRFVTTKEPLGNNAYRRSAVMILLKAIYDVAGRENIEKVVLHYSVGCGYYFTMRGARALDQTFLNQVRARMQEIVEENLPIGKRGVSTDEAIALFHQYGMHDKERLFRYRRVSKVNLYSINNFEDYYYGFMASSTGYIRYFDLQLYDDGFVLLLPEAGQPDQIPEFIPAKKVFAVQKESEQWGEKLEIDTVGELNDQITRKGIRHILLIQEALQEANISEIAEQIVSRGDVKFVMIAGPSSSGKTTFSHRLSIQLEAHGLRPHPIAVDNYFVDREHTPVDAFGEKDYECLEAIDVEKFNRDMLALLAGERIELPVFNFVSGKQEYKGDFLQLGREDILVIEGIHGLNEKLSYALPARNKFKIYISALTQLNIDEHNRIPTTDGRLIRRIVRDARTRGTSARETIARWPSVRRGEEQNIFPFQEEADAMFNSALIYELACLKVYAEPLLFGIERTDPEYLEAHRLLKFLDYFVPVPSEEVPHNSILREFIGGSCFRV